MSEVALDKLVGVYVKIRDKRAELKKEFEAQDEQLSAQLQELSNEMLERCKEMGADSTRTPHGTIIRSIKSKYWTSDWDSMYQFIREHDAFGLLEKRLHQSNMKQFLSENPDVLPSGLNVENEYSIVIRKSKEK